MKKPKENDLDSQIPSIARSATASAYRRAVKKGSVLQYRNGALRLIEIGKEERVVKVLSPRKRITAGSRFELLSAQK